MNFEFSTRKTFGSTKNIQFLPPEVLENILDSLSVTNLVNSCRLVNRQWNAISSGVCRQRLTNFKSPTAARLQQLVTTLKNSSHSPFSSCKFYQNHLYTSGKIGVELPTIIGFIQDYSHQYHIQHLTLQGYNLEVLLDILQFTSSLKHLNYLSAPLHVNEDEPPLKNSELLNIIPQNLSALQSLQFEVNGQVSFDMFQLFTSSSRILHQVALSLRPNGREFWSRVASILTKYEIISLSIHSNSSENYSEFQALKLTELSIKIPVIRNYVPGYYFELEDFLQRVSPSLKKFVIVHLANCNNVAAGPMLNLPQFPNLNCFKILENRVESPYMISPPLKFVNQFPIEFAPNLKSMTLGTNGGTFEHFRSRKFKTVEELSVQFLLERGNFEQNDWSRIFPNLRKLSTRANASDFRYIVSKMRKLEILELELQQVDVNTMLSGREDPVRTAVYYDIRVQNSRFLTPPDEISSIFTLRSLRELTLDCRHVGPLTDCGIFLSLLQINPLSKLVIKNGRISTKSIRLLKEYHIEFYCHSNENSSRTCSQRIGTSTLTPGSFKT